MSRIMCRAKIHKATITKTALDYEGSIGIDKTLIKACGMLPYERVQVMNLANGERFETYIIEEEKDSGSIILYGPAAYKGKQGDEIIIVSYSLMDGKDAISVKPKVVYVDAHNRIKVK